MPRQRPWLPNPRMRNTWKPATAGPAGRPAILLNASGDARRPLRSRLKARSTRKPGAAAPLFSFLFFPARGKRDACFFCVFSSLFSPCFVTLAKSSEVIDCYRYSRVGAAFFFRVLCEIFPVLPKKPFLQNRLPLFPAKIARQKPANVQAPYPTTRSRDPARIWEDVYGPADRGGIMTDTPQLLLAHHLKALKLPTFLREYDKLARQCAAEGLDHIRFLLRLAELELIERERRMVERRIKEARFPAVKSLDSFDFAAIPSLNKTLVLELARSEYVTRRENIIAVGNSGTGKTHIGLGLGLAACQKGLSVGFNTAAALVHELLEARDEKRLLRLQRQLAGYKLLIIDELGYVPLSQTGAELLFEVFSQRYERGSTVVTSNLPFDEWTSVFGSERLTGALLDRLTHHVHILQMNGDSYRLNQSKTPLTPCQLGNAGGQSHPGLMPEEKAPSSGGLLASIADVFLLRPADAFLLRR